MKLQQYYLVRTQYLRLNAIGALGYERWYNYVWRNPDELGPTDTVMAISSKPFHYCMPCSMPDGTVQWCDAPYLYHNLENLA